MAGKKKVEKAGAPAWMVTFGDMMSLLFCFFVIMVALSEIKEDKFETVIRSFKEHYGQENAKYRVPGLLSGDVKEMIKVTQTEDGERQISSSGTTELEGGELAVMSVKRGKLITMGGKMSFEFNSTELKPATRRALKKMAPSFIARPRILEIIGHSAAEEAADIDGGYYKLSCDRCQVVADVLAEAGVPRTKMKLISAGPFDTVGLATPKGAKNCQRVEILITEEYYSSEVER